MNNLLKAIEILQLHLRENNNVKNICTHANISSRCPTILAEKNKHCYLLFSYANANNPHICKLYNFQKKSESSYCKACTNEKNYLLRLHKIAYLKKNDSHKLCIDLRKKFDKISKLEELYKRECDELIQFKELLKTQPTIYSESKEKLAKYDKKKSKLQKQIALENNKLLAKRINYIILFKTIDL
jgi:DNA repair ATPase RecN